MAGRDAFRPFWQAEGNVCCLMEMNTFVGNLGRTLMILSSQRKAEQAVQS